MNLSDVGLPTPIGPFAAFTQAIITKQVYLSNLSAGLTYELDTYAGFGYNVTDVYIHLSSGSVTAAIQINGTGIPGLNSMSVTSSTITHYSASGGSNSVAAGQTLSLALSSASSVLNLNFTLVATRTS